MARQDIDGEVLAGSNMSSCAPWPHYFMIYFVLPLWLLWVTIRFTVFSFLCVLVFCCIIFWKLASRISLFLQVRTALWCKAFSFRLHQRMALFCINFLPYVCIASILLSLSHCQVFVTVTYTETRRFPLSLLSSMSSRLGIITTVAIMVQNAFIGKSFTICWLVRFFGEINVSAIILFSFQCSVIMIPSPIGRHAV